MRKRKAVQTAAKQHRAQRQKNAAPVKPDADTALHRHRQAKDRQRMERLILQAGLNPAHFNHAQGFTQNMRPERAQSNVNKTADSGDNQHKTAGHGHTLS
ncbi:Uncharacterised protein [Salmonella enterica subsp. enterica serovar Bovismorbificans]|uniref:Uncharacterized protein n=1 Tax=Salmonella enterica subsp. enterica serovar Bovismorbificans TaxID=58097 RepID=A0A655CHC2_SALET|nr:Uncharacterised protein [Salmonella enterica subsp. enterica serovar Bovismorbificans]